MILTSGIILPYSPHGWNVERANATANNLSVVHVATLAEQTRYVASRRVVDPAGYVRRAPCSQRRSQCTWGRETAKKARTQQHFESLVNHIKSLEQRVRELEGDLQRAREPTRRSGSVSDAARSVASSSLSPHPSPVAKLEPDDDLVLNGHDELDPANISDDESEIDQLIAPTRHLVVSTASHAFFFQYE